MGLNLSNLFFLKRQVNVVIWGVGYAGKTAVLYKLVTNNFHDSIPTIGKCLYLVQ